MGIFMTIIIYINQYVKREVGPVLYMGRRFLVALMRLPSNCFKALAGDRLGQYSVRINDQWRICFEWYQDGPHNVEITDYH